MPQDREALQARDRVTRRSLPSFAIRLSEVNGRPENIPALEAPTKVALSYELASNLLQKVRAMDPSNAPARARLLGEALELMDELYTSRDLYLYI